MPLPSNPSPAIITRWFLHQSAMCTRPQSHADRAGWASVGEVRTAILFVLFPLRRCYLCRSGKDRPIALAIYIEFCYNRVVFGQGAVRTLLNYCVLIGELTATQSRISLLSRQYFHWQVWPTMQNFACVKDSSIEGRNQHSGEERIVSFVCALTVTEGSRINTNE